MFLNRKPLFLLLALGTLSAYGPLVAQAETAPAESHAITLEDKLVDEGQKQLKKIRVCLTSISSIIKKNSKLSKELQDKIVAHFKELDHVILEKLQAQKFVEVDMATAYSLLQINNIIIDHINELVRTNFRAIDSCDTTSLLEKMMPTKGTLKPEQIAIRLQSNSKKLDELVKKAQGLRWYNHISRTVDEWVVTPCQRYSIPRRTAIAGGTVVLASLVWWQLHYQSMKRVCDTFSSAQEGEKSWFDTVYGPPYAREEETAELNRGTGNTSRRGTGWMGRAMARRGIPRAGVPLPQIEYGYLGSFDRLVWRWLQNYSKTTQTVFGLTVAGLAAEFHNFYPKIKKQLDILKNKLKGGVYMKEAERAAEVVETVRFKDIFGQSEIKRYFQLLVDYLEDPETFDRLGLTPPKGILCIGDTRTGKTFCVNALFGEINEMLDRTGQSGKYKLINLPARLIQVRGMEYIKQELQQYAPCIAFIDEIDLLDLQRTGQNNTLSEFLTAMGDAVNSKDSKKQVIVIAATNRPETLDIALRQPGRFGKELRFEYPNYQDRLGFIRERLEELSLSSDAINVTKMAQYTENKSYEALNMLIRNAIIKARLRGEVLTQAILDETLDEDIYHIIPNYTKQIPEEELNILAAHFAGQALVITMLDNSIRLAKVTVKQVMTELKEEMMGTHLWSNDKNKEQQRFEYGKIFTCHAQDSISMSSRAAKLKLCKMYLAGFVAEELLLGSCGYSCHAEVDKNSALSLAQSIAFEGYDIKTMPRHIQNQKHDEALALLEQCKKETRELLTQNSDALEKLAHALTTHQTLDHEQVKAVVQPAAVAQPAT